MDSGTGSMVTLSGLKETHSHSPPSTTTQYSSVPLHRIVGPDPDLNARFWFSIYSQHRRLFLPHPGPCPGRSVCVSGGRMLWNLSLYFGGTGDFDQHPGCLHTDRLGFLIPCCHSEKKCCVKKKTVELELNKSNLK